MMMMIRRLGTRQVTRKVIDQIERVREREIKMTEKKRNTSRKKGYFNTW